MARSEEQLERETILSLTHEDDRERCRQQLDGLTASRYPSFTLEKRYTRPDDEAVWVRNSFSLLRDEAGRPSHIVLVCNDISDRRRAERLLIESEKLSILGQLSASIAHEINNPLESVLNLLYLAGTSDSLDDVRTFTASAEAEVRHAIQIATDTLSFQKTQKSAIRSDVAAILRSVLTLFESKMTKGRVTLRLSMQACPQVLCFPGELRQVFANLIRNSLEAMPRGGELCIRLRPATEWLSGSKGVRFTIIDTGCGMSPETRSQLFRPFFTTKGSAGTGLGMWITRVILDKHRTRIHVRSSDASPRLGTASTMVFPLQGAEGSSPGIGAIAEI